MCCGCSKNPHRPEEEGVKAVIDTMTETSAGDPAALTFRAAAAADVAAAVPLIYSSGPAAFDYVFETGGTRRAQDFLRFAFLKGGGEFGWRVHRVAEFGGRVTAAGAAFDGGAVLRFTIANALQILQFFGPIRAWGVMVRGLRVEAIIRPPRAEEYYLCHVGVREELRGHGIGTRFMRNLLEGVAAHRHRCAALDVAVTNPRARSLYEKLGFEIEALRTSSLQNRLGRVPDHYRMSRPAGD
jgi:ribosomal protein S18 acetylase RimI-like enzyme